MALEPLLPLSTLIRTRFNAVLFVPKVPRYTYVRLSELKPGTVVNVYGLVVFFKQPSRTRGTGQSSTAPTSVHGTRAEYSNAPEPPQQGASHAAETDTSVLCPAQITAPG